MAKMSAKLMASRIVELVDYRYAGLTLRQAQEAERVYSMTVGVARALRSDWIRNLTPEGRDELAATLADLLTMVNNPNRGTGDTELHDKCGHFVNSGAHKGRCEKDEYQAKEIDTYEDGDLNKPEWIWIVQRGNADTFGQRLSERMTEAEAREIAHGLSSAKKRINPTIWRAYASTMLRWRAHASTMLREMHEEVNALETEEF